jgi:hypothetical protein
MNLEEEIQIMEMKESYSLTGFGKEINEKLAIKGMIESNYTLSLEEANNQDIEADESEQGIEQPEQAPDPRELTIPGPNASIITDEQIPEPEQVNDNAGDDWAPGRKSKVLALGTAVIILIAAIMGLLYTTSGGLTGQMTGHTTVTRDVQKVVDFNQAFSQATETQLELSNIISFKISGKLEGTGAKVKLRINGTDYLVADIVNPSIGNLKTGTVQATAEETPQYTITTDKSSYLPGESVTISITPDAENKSLYVSYGEQTQKLESNTYTPEVLGEYQAIVLITLPDNILRLETNFTVGNETITETPEPAPPETTGYEFTALCAETCTIPLTTNPVLIIEPTENSTLTITGITTTQERENNAPVQVQVIPDMTIKQGETAILELDKYFSDPDGDTIQYDLNEIPGINATIAQNTLTITSANLGVYIAYVYATDGDKLATSNTFEITVNPAETTSQGQETNTTINETTPEPVITADPCTVGDINQKPSYCFAGIEDQVYQELSAPLENREGALLGRFNKFGNLIIKGLLVQGTTGEPATDDFKIGITETVDYKETTTYTAWISKETGNLYLKGIVHEEQEALQPPQFDSYTIQNKFGIVLAYFDERTGDLYLKGNIVQLGKI